MPLRHPARAAGAVRRRLLPTVLAVALLGAACSDDRTGPAPSVASATTGPAVTTTEPAAADDPATTTEPAMARTSSWETLGEPGVGGRITGLAVDPFDSDRYLVGGDLLGVGLSTDGGTTWQPTFGLTNSEVARFTFHPTRRGEVWVGTMGGPFVSLDGGRTWTERRGGMPAIQEVGYSAPVEVILVDPANRDRLVAFGGSHREWTAPGTIGWGDVWESTDRGNRWQRIATVADGANLVDAAVVADGSIVVAALGRGIFRSTDGGRTWQARNDGLPHLGVRAIAAHPTDPALLWVALGGQRTARGDLAGGVFRSTDGGARWIDSSAGLDVDPANAPAVENLPRYDVLAVSPVDPAVLFTANLGFGKEGIYRSTDGGVTWLEVVDDGKPNRPTTAYATPVTANAIAAHPTDARRLLVGNSEYVLRSDDAGATWRDLTSRPVGAGAFVGTGYSGLVANRVVFGPDGEEVLCGFDGANPLVGDVDGGWRRPVVAWTSWGGCVDAAPSTASAGTWYVLLGQAGIFGGIARIDAAGRVEVAEGAGAGLPARDRDLGRLGAIEVVRDAAGTEVVLASLGGDLFRSVDGGRTWQIVSAGLAVEDLRADPTHRGRVYLTAADGVRRSDDGGLTSGVLAGSPPQALRLTLDSAGSRLYATVWRTAGAGLWRMEPDGRWTQLSAERSAHEVAVHPADGNHLVLATNDHPYSDRVKSKGVLVSLDGGQTWTESNDGLPLLRVATVAFDPAEPDRLVIGTYGRGYFQRSEG